MKKNPVVFIVLKEYDNLGVGYMASLLSEAGLETKVIDFRKKKSDILKTLKRLDPELIGFSVIYQNHINQFIDLICYLRKGGIKSHFTAGGHYASLKYEELFEFIPQLDSIVRFEGEYTMLKLANSIKTGGKWKEIQGIAYKYNGKVIVNPLRLFESDLDKFPFPLRSPLKTYAFEMKFATIIAGRGCNHDCSFCNTKKFYSQTLGPIKRIRKPEMVIKEMGMLYHKKNCSIFLFLDDDFPLKSVPKPEWIVRFCNELKNKKLNDKIMWKINCRPDEVDEKSFSLMKSNGLFLVFLGIEDGTDIGLKRLNKKMSVTRSLKGINTLKKLEIEFDYGFMLFQPYTTYKSLNENLDFLRQICGDGYTPVTFLKMMPYYETKVEKELIKDGRLKVLPGTRDYDFLDDSLNRYYDFVIDCFMEWLRNTDGLENTSNWARNYISVYKYYFDIQPDVLRLFRKIRRTISESNLFLLDTMKELALIFESKQSNNDNNNLLESYRGKIKSKHDGYKKKIINTMGDFLQLAYFHHYSMV